jgi:methionyl-tRNA synthetase
MGKEIFVRFHATLWPAMLMALDLPLPKQIYAHGWWTARGGSGKLGKSTGGLPTPEAFTSLLAERAGISLEIAADAQRYILCREMNFGLDTDFNLDNCLQRYNTDLANDLGNLLNRSINMVDRYMDGIIPNRRQSESSICTLASKVTDEYIRALNAMKLNSALESAWKLVARMNKYIDEMAPWTLAKRAGAGDVSAVAELHAVLYECLEATRISTVLLTPFMPIAAGAMRHQLGLDNAPAWDETLWGILEPGSKVGPPTPVFPRIQNIVLDEADLRRLGAIISDPHNSVKEKHNTLEQLSSGSTSAEASPRSGELVVPNNAADETKTPEPPIGIEDFMKVQLRVGDILAAESIPNATKLLRLTVQLGEDDTRTILAGIAEFYEPEALVGRQVVVVANLQPRKMRGIESQGMLLAADLDGRPILLQPDTAVPSGSQVR